MHKLHKPCTHAPQSFNVHEEKEGEKKAERGLGMRLSPTLLQSCPQYLRSKLIRPIGA